MIHHPPAYCHDHGLFPAKDFAIKDATDLSLVGCSVSCPACGEQSEVLSGAYDALPDRLDFVLDESISANALEALRSLAESVGNNDISVPEAKLEAEKISPRAGKLFANWSEESKTTIAAALIGAIALVAAARVSRSPEQTVIIQPVIERVIEGNSEQRPEEPQSTPQSELPPKDPSEKPKSDR